MKSRAIRIVLRALVVTAATFSFEAASAHDVWLTLAGDAAARRAIINYGHPDDRPPAIADKVLDLFEIKSGDRASPLAGLEGVQRDGVLVVQSEPFADDGHILLAVRYDNGYWIKTVGGLYRNATRRLAPDAVDSVWSSKFAKALTGPGAPWQTVLGHDFEIVPLSDPATIKPGETLRLRVLFHGRPLEGAEVERGDGVTSLPEQDIPRFKTDAEGVASITVVAPGPHLLVVDHRVKPSATPDQANEDLYTATLWFETRSPL